MENEIKELLASTKSLETATIAEIKTIKDSIEAVTKGAATHTDTIADLKDAIVALEQRSKPVVNSNAEQKSLQKALFEQVLKTGVDPKTGMQVQELITEAKGFIIGDPLSAGAGVEDELSRSILTSMRESYTLLGMFGNYAVKSVEHSRMVQKTWAATSWAGENTTNTAGFLGGNATPTFEKVEIGRASCRERVCLYV